MTITRFAPSTTGDLHLGGLRTAIFSWLYAKHSQGQCLLRFEDTDQARSRPELVKKFMSNFAWMNIDFDAIYYQSQRYDSHLEVAQALIEKGSAYYCGFPSAEEEEKIKSLPLGEQKKIWRNYAQNDRGAKSAIRFKSPEEGCTVMEDQVFGPITVNNKELDDLVIVRSNDTPTYVFASLVDDHFMGVSHVIRGTDHINNTMRQIPIYQAMGWEVPKFAHIPLIHGTDGQKLSKRHGATSVDQYREMGILPEALFNYLLLLGWSYQNQQIISLEEAIENFDLTHLSKSPACFDLNKLKFINGVYLGKLQDEELFERTKPFIKGASEQGLGLFKTGLLEIKERSKTLIELVELGQFYLQPLPSLDKPAKQFVQENREEITKLYEELTGATEWSKPAIELIIKALSKKREKPAKVFYEALRALITGSLVSPNIISIMLTLKKDNSLQRIRENLHNSA